jgi:hypothetical protein
MRKIICSILLAVLFLSSAVFADVQAAAINAGKLIGTENGRVLTDQMILNERRHGF